jgi:hypothetical protein
MTTELNSAFGEMVTAMEQGVLDLDAFLAKQTPDM